MLVDGSKVSKLITNAVNIILDFATLEEIDNAIRKLQQEKKIKLSWLEYIK